MNFHEKFYVCGCWKMQHKGGSFSLCRFPTDPSCELHAEYHRSYKRFERILIADVILLVAGSLVAVLLENWWLGISVWVVGWIFLVFGPPKVPQDMPEEVGEAEWMVDRVTQKRNEQ